MKRILATVLAASLPAVVVWLFGYNFDARGATAGFTFVLSSIAGYGAWDYPGWRK